MTKAIGYYRLSHSGSLSVSEQNEKLEKQRRMVQQHAEETGKSIVKGFEDRDTSGRKEKPYERENFVAALDYLIDHESVEEILVHNYDRITRQVVMRVALPEIIEVYTGRSDIDVYSTAEDQGYMKSYANLDTDTNMGEFLTIVVKGFSSQYEKMKESYKREESLAEKRENGDPVGRQPQGITTDKKHPDYESESATMYLPDPDDMDRFNIALQIIDYVESNGGGFGDENAGSAYSIGKKFGIENNPHNIVTTIWKNKEKFRLAAKNDRDAE